jgi:hypothetical protein
MSEALPVWNCKFSPLPGEGAPQMNELTVGSKFAMSCQGEIPVEWKQEAGVEARFAKKEESYTLYVLKAEKLSSNNAELTVTAYKPGKHAPEYIRIVQGDKGFEALKPTWEVQSVLPKDQPPQPYGPFGPWSLDIPYWIFGALAILLCLIGFLVVRKLRKITQRRRMLEELALHKTALSPAHQFYRDSRTLRRRLNGAGTTEELRTISSDLNKDFRLYVLRQFQIPALEWSDRAIVEDMRKRYRLVHREAAEPLRRTLRELGRIVTQPNPLLPDVEQLHRMSLEAVEKIELAQENAKTKGASR